ncbi:hypothetical protein BT96DRAFT_837223 [Gymnopus androsaceus JB14]|uniref:2'-phosphotransferase n=1 Tax=Gymnopus androsaceus JB14 TaxID=1447944 RepID=A0A6A4GQZ0_9AGAR|nr:hypothetical protein BT96DRAFT_837223 [Gymnopus androsaceus JB14]
MFSRSNISNWHIQTLFSSAKINPWRGYGTKSGGAATRKHFPNHADLQISKSLSWLLRHGGPSEGLQIRSDGYVRVKDLVRHTLRHPALRRTDFLQLERVVKADAKGRFTLNYEAQLGGSEGSDCWWIRANQGHSFETGDLELKRIGSAESIPVAVHGTTEEAWKSISIHGISRMTRNHIHLAQGFAGKDVDQVFRIRKSSRILIYLDVEKAVAGGIKFYLSSNGVILSPGNEVGYLEPKYFQRVEKLAVKQLQLVEGWEAPVEESNPQTTAKGPIQMQQEALLKYTG